MKPDEKWNEGEIMFLKIAFHFCIVIQNDMVLNTILFVC